MKKNSKLMLVVTLVLLVAFASGAYAAGKLVAENVTIHKGVRVVIDGEELYPKDAKGRDVPMFILNGTTYLPLRAISNVFEKPIEWDGVEKTVYLGQKPGGETFMRLKTYYEAGEASADERFVWEDSHKDINGVVKENVVYPRLEEIDEENSYENPEPYGISHQTAGQAGDEGIVLNGQFKRFTGEFFVPEEINSHPYYTYDEVYDAGVDTHSEPAMLTIMVKSMSGVSDEWRTVFEKEIKSKDKSYKIDLDMTNVEAVHIWMRSGQSHDGLQVMGMLADPTFYK